MENSRLKSHVDILPRTVVTNGRGMAIAKDTLRNTHPLPDTAAEFGSPANLLPLFGDTGFWSFLAKNHRGIFDHLINVIQALPNPVKGGTYYGTYEVDPIGFIRDYFPQAYALVHQLQPDFVSQNPGPSYIWTGKA